MENWDRDGDPEVFGWVMFGETLEEFADQEGRGGVWHTRNLMKVGYGG